MPRPVVDPGIAQANLEMRRARLRGAVDRPLRPVRGDAALPADSVNHLRNEAEELFWTELSWEQMTDEEQVAGGRLTDLVFPGFLAFVDGLLLDSCTARPHPEVVEAILLFLAERYTAFSAELEGGADSQRVVFARAMTVALIDLVLCRLYRLTPTEREEIEGLA